MFKDAQMCTMGFPTTVPDCTADNCVIKGSDTLTTLVIPEMSFTCLGTVTGWRVAGEIHGGDKNSFLIIWRERSNEPGTYDRVNRTELGICGDGSSVTGISNVYECTLPQDERVSVQPGDIVGMQLPEVNNVRFQLYFNSNNGPTNYIFNHRSSPTINLNNSPELDQFGPQISLTVETTSITQIPMTELTDGSTISSGPSSIGAKSITNSDHTTFQTTRSSKLDDNANISNNDNNSDTSIAIVGAIVGILLVFISVLLLILILRRQRIGQKSSPASN